MDNPIVSTDLTESKEVEQGKEITEYNTPNCDNEKKDEYIKNNNKMKQHFNSKHKDQITCSLCDSKFSSDAAAAECCC